MKSSRHFACWLIILAAFPAAHAEVKPASLFTDGAVFQQGLALPVWGTARDGEKITVQFDGDKAEATAKDGKWSVHLKPHKAGGPFTLTVAGENTVTVNNILVGEVWICSGQSNMHFSLNNIFKTPDEKSKENYPKIRLFTVAQKPAISPGADVEGKWSECTPQSAGDFSAVGYFFGRDIHKATGFPVGLIHSSWGGTPAQAWTSLSGLEAEKELQDYVASIKAITEAYPAASEKYSREEADYEAKLKQWTGSDEEKAHFQTVKTWTKENRKAIAEGKPPLPKPGAPAGKPYAPTPPEGGPRTPTVLYNGMIAPLIPYAIKGVIWYQGEANRGKAKEYQTLFPRMITDWRQKWGEGDFPFLFVQIAPFSGMSPEIREAQLLTLSKTQNTAMAVTTDVGNANSIHPKQKEPVGARLALAARALAYGEQIEYSGPVFDTLKIDGSRAVLSFKHVGTGLIAQGGELKGFTVAGPDKKFVPAKAEIEGDTVIVSNEQTPNPTEVRYGWANVPDVNLFNKEGLPASPFRTDVKK